MAEKLKIIPLGGLNEIGKNMTAYEYGGEIIVVDCGMAFPGDDMYGIDCVIPDVSYLIKNKSRIRGLFITHGHEDHIGAIPYVLKQINMPIYCTRFTAGLIKLKLEEHQLVKSTKLITVEAGKSVRAGKFTVEFIHVNHSIADSVAFAIHTKMGTIVHTGDFKIDSTPIDGEVIDLARLGELGKEGVLCLCADSTNVERPGFTPSEKVVGATFMRQFQNCDERIIVTTFASNVHRVQQVLDAAAQCGRKVAVTGRSMENMMKVSTELGYMKVPKNTLVDINKLKGLPKNKQVIVTTGSQGEEMSALYRMAFSTHKQVEIGAGDKVILSASAVPGNEVTVGRVINELFRKGATVVYDRADMLHVSGHACQEELKIIHALTKPRFFVPLHGEQRMLQIHCQLAQQMGMDRNHIAIADNGGVIEITGKSMKLSANSVPAGEVYVDGSGVGDVGAVVMRDRKRLAEDGMVVVVLPIATQDGALLSPPEIITRGFIYVKESGDLMKELQNVAMNAADSVTGSRKRSRDDGELRSAVKSAVSSYLFKTPYTSATGEHFLFNTPENRAFVKRFATWYNQGLVTTQTIYGSYTSGLFVSDSGIKSYMSIGSSAGATHQRPTKGADGNYPFEVGITTIPQVDASNAKVISQGPSLCIFKKANAQEVAASWLFVKYLTTTVDFQAEFSMASGYVPVIKSVANNEVYAEFVAGADGGDNVAALAAKVCLEQVDAYYTSPAFPGSSEARSRVGELMAGCMTDAAALGDLTKPENDAKLDELIQKRFDEAITKCEQSIAGFGI